MTVTGSPVVQPTAEEGFITLAEARDLVRDSALLSTASTYPNVRVDRAIKMVGEKTLEFTKADTVVHEVSIPASAGPVNFQDTTGMERFTPKRWLGGRIDNDPVRKVGIQTIFKWREQGNETGEPGLIGWETTTRAFLYPTPGSPVTLHTRWYRPLVDFNYGTTGASNIQLNIPADWAREVFWWGGSAALVHSDPDELLQSMAWRRFLDILQQMQATDNADNAIDDPDPRDYV